MPGQDYDTVAALLDGLSFRDVRELVLDALRICHEQAPERQDAQLNDNLGNALIFVLTDRKKEPRPSQSCKEVFLYDQALPGLALFLEVLCSLTTQRVVVPLMISERGRVMYISLRTTAGGLRLLKGTDDHPLAPRFIQRLRERCPRLSADVLAHMVDAQACREAGLLRPSVILTGLAYETAIEFVLKELVSKGFRIKVPATAAERIRKLKNELLRIGLDKSERDRAMAAVDYAEVLRDRRNDGTHTTPRYPFDDAPEVEDLLLLAGHHLPPLWAVPGLAKLAQP